MTGIILVVLIILGVTMSASAYAPQADIVETVAPTTTVMTTSVITTTVEETIKETKVIVTEPPTEEEVIVEENNYLEEEPIEYEDNYVEENNYLEEELIGYEDNYVEENYIVESNSYSGSAAYSPSDLQFYGVLYWGEWRWTWYSEQILPGYGLSIPGRHTDGDGFVCDGDGYICLASSSLSKGTIVDTPFGRAGKVYDCGCASDVLDVYVNW